MSGAIAGSVTQLCLHPIDTIKTRLQVRGLSVLRLRPSNIRALYAGLTSNVLGEAPSSAMFYATYETLVRRLQQRCDEQDEQEQRALVHLSAATVASVFASIIRVPSEVVKTQLQTGQVCVSPYSTASILTSSSPSLWR